MRTTLFTYLRLVFKMPQSVFSVIGIIFSGVYLMSCGTSTGAAQELWVSPNGSDSANGDQDHPFRTLQKAQIVVRSLVADAGGDIVVNIMAGTYRLKETLILDSSDGGKNGNNVIYRAVPGSASPVICGSIPVNGWSVDPSPFSGGKIWRAKVGTDIPASRQLYVNGQRVIRARTGSLSDSARSNEYPVGFRTSYQDYTPLAPAHHGGIECTVNTANPVGWRDASKWTNIKSIEAVVVTQWKMMSVPLDSMILSVKSKINPKLTVGLIKMQEPGWQNANVFVSDTVTNTPGIWSFWQITRFENAYEFIDMPGEWYQNTSDGYLYYMPKQGENMNQAIVELPIIDTLISGQGTLEHPVANIRFEGLTFSYATWYGPSSNEGYVSDQSGFHLTGNKNKTNTIGHVQDLTRTPGNISFSYAHNIQFTQNTFMHLGGVALDFTEGCQYDTISFNSFSDISSAAVQLGEISDSAAHTLNPIRFTSHNSVSYNSISKTGRDYFDAAGIMVGFTSFTSINNNDISDVPWSGIAIGWGWGLYDTVTVNGNISSFPGLPGGLPNQWGNYKVPSNNHDNNISSNLISNFLTRVWDGGSIYTTGYQGSSYQNGLTITGNVAFNKYPLGGSNIFYTDGGSRFITLKGNVSYNNQQGYFYFGPPINPTDQLNYPPGALNIILGVVDSLPYGSEIGGCVTFGDIWYEGNYWQNLWTENPSTKLGRLDDLEFLILQLSNKDSLPQTMWPQNPIYYDPCTQSVLGGRYPKPYSLVFKNNIIFQTQNQIPGSLLSAAGRGKK